jgi:CheY-like chemotaxis protein
MATGVLIVEDEEELREILKDSLVLAGLDVAVAADGRAALDVLATRSGIGIILLDLLMPGMNGWEFFEAMRKVPAYDAIHVVVTSSAPSRAPAGVTRVIRKPLQLKPLLAMLHELCPS